MTVVRVQKKDGSFQDWDKNKILNAVAKVGLSAEDTESVASLVESWVIKNAVNNTIKSEEIRTKIVQLLSVIDTKASQAFDTYKKV
jgi:transcriptional regulator NrdR family protein